jgi:hypothetical protein
MLVGLRRSLAGSQKPLALTLNTTHGGTETLRNPWDSCLNASPPRCVVIVNASEVTLSERRPEPLPQHL